MKKNIYYSDPLHDDFALTHGRIRKKVIDAEYHYTHRSPVWHFASFVLYRLIVTPLAELLMRTVYGLRIRNRRALRDCVYDFMCRAVAAQGSYAYIQYQSMEEKEA